MAGIILLLLPLIDIKGILQHLFVFIGLILLSFVFLGYSFYLLSKRKQGKGFFWDEQGVVIDLNGIKVYWDEIEDIKFFQSSVTHMRSTIIYPHYTNQEKIRIRRKKSMPTPEHSIDWYLIEKPKEYHKNLIKDWEEKRY
ncbi:hypothetical protein LC085_00005 [Bacillus tianshenii]|uniref:hypothetical protein n=1 Tax=Sutcliffiella tianshenii TaxID=1463404 RepID=UPI001CD52434|nr:hypothetical protein [Bacillus tianshenii]MCA1318276.1 hypothetical protein [Bacillus tianshenii]